MKKLLFCLLSLFLVSCELDQDEDTVYLFLRVYDKEQDIVKIHMSGYALSDTTNALFNKTSSAPTQKAQQSVFLISGTIDDPRGDYRIVIYVEDSKDNISELIQL